MPRRIKAMLKKKTWCGEHYNEQNNYKNEIIYVQSQGLDDSRKK